MAHFKGITMETPSPDQINAVVMGRKTWESIPPKFRPLPGRINVVLTRQTDYSILLADGNNGSTPSNDNVFTVSSLDQALSRLSERTDVGNVFVIGGAQIYEQAIQQGKINQVIYTEIENLPQTTPMDAFFPELPETEWDKSLLYPVNGKDDSHHVDDASGLRYCFYQFTRKERNTEELQYLDLCRRILDTGIRKGDRTGTGTLSIFGTQMRFNLRNGTLPLLTTKRTFWRGVAEELLWFIAVRTSSYQSPFFV
jgi:dihydrofolate reductase / thymidylate synthase